MNIAIVTACPNAQVSSVLSARLLEAAAHRLGWSTRVEVYDPQQPQGQLSAAEIAAADWVLVVNSGPLDLQRFAGKRLFQSTPAQALSDTQHFLCQAAEHAAVYQPVAETPSTPIERSAKIVAITACPTGVAHTFMAAEALQQAAQQLGYQLTVETQGSVGARNPLPPAAIAEADVVLLAADIEVPTERFAGKRIYRCGTGVALKQAQATLNKALAEGREESAGAGATVSTARSEKTGVYKHLLTGVSFMLPMVVAGGLLIALSFVFGIEAFKEPGTLPAALMQIGGDAAFKLMVPLLAGYIAYSIADRPGLAPGMIGGLLASLFTGLEMIYVVGKPVAGLLEGLTQFLDSMGTTNAILLGELLGGMMCVDLGGPINKAAYAFSVGLLASQSYAPMAATMAAGMVPPIGLGIASFIARRKFAQSEREAGKAAFVLGLCFISEGAIPFAAKDPLRVIPASIAGGALTGALSMYFGCKLMAPHGGLLVMLIPNAINHALLYLLAILAGSLLTALVYAVLKRSEVVELAVQPVKA